MSSPGLPGGIELEQSLCDVREDVREPLGHASHGDLVELQHRPARLVAGRQQGVTKPSCQATATLASTETSAELTFHAFARPAPPGSRSAATPKHVSTRGLGTPGRSRRKAIGRADALPFGFGHPPGPPLSLLGVSSDFRPEAEMANAEDVTSSAFSTALRGGRDSKPSRNFARCNSRRFVHAHYSDRHTNRREHAS